MGLEINLKNTKMDSRFNFRSGTTSHINLNTELKKIQLNENFRTEPSSAVKTNINLNKKVLDNSYKNPLKAAFKDYAKELKIQKKNLFKACCQILNYLKIQ